MVHLQRAVGGVLFAGVLLFEGHSPAETALIGYITDTECGPDHAPMIARGGMGADGRECTYRCVEKGATFGFVEIDRKKFFQLDDQVLPRPHAGRRVRIEGTLEGDTIRVRKIEAD
jgi:hypothetical protein